MENDTQIPEIQKYLPAAQNILIALPTSSDIDGLAAGLSLFLSLAQTGKNIAIVSDNPVKVGQSNLFGVGQIQNSLPAGSGGNLTIVLGGVVDSNTKLPPTLQELKYFPEGSDLHLVFYPLPGQKFEPTHITPKYEQVGYDLIFTVGAFTLNHLGAIYANNQPVFGNGKIVNIDNKLGNSQFGLVNLFDQSASSLSEIVYQLIAGLNLPLNGDIASNILAGVYAATNSLQATNVNANTFETLAQAIKAGGQRPNLMVPGNGQVPVQSPQMQSAGIFNSLFNQPRPNPSPSGVEPEPQPSPEEVPQAEQAVTPEEGWLTPKIYKGSSLGSL